MELVKLRRIHHRDKARLAMFFEKGAKLEKVVRNINGVKFSITHKCWYVDDTSSNLELVLNRLNSIAEVDQSDWSSQQGASADRSAEANENMDLARRCLRELQDKLNVQGYSKATYQTYSSQFELFLKFYKYSDPLALEEAEINN